MARDGRSYADKLLNPRWQQKRLEIFQRDGFSCRYCKSKTKTLHVHHLFYFKDLDPWDINDGFLLTLCENCHLEEKSRFGTEESIVQVDIGNLLGEIWASGYNVNDLVLIQKAIFYTRKKPDGIITDMNLDVDYKKENGGQ